MSRRYNIPKKCLAHGLYKSVSAITCASIEADVRNYSVVKGFSDSGDVEHFGLPKSPRTLGYHIKKTFDIREKLNRYKLFEKHFQLLR